MCTFLRVYIFLQSVKYADHSSNKAVARNKTFDFWIIQCCILQHRRVVLLLSRLLQKHQEIRKNMHILQKCAHFRIFQNWEPPVFGQRAVDKNWERPSPRQWGVLRDGVRESSHNFIMLLESLFKNYLIFDKKCAHFWIMDIWSNIWKIPLENFHLLIFYPTRPDGSSAASLSIYPILLDFRLRNILGAQKRSFLTYLLIV